MSNSRTSRSSPSLPPSPDSAPSSTLVNVWATSSFRSLVTPQLNSSAASSQISLSDMDSQLSKLNFNSGPSKKTPAHASVNATSSASPRKWGQPFPHHPTEAINKRSPQTTPANVLSTSSISSIDALHEKQSRESSSRVTTTRVAQRWGPRSNSGTRMDSQQGAHSTCAVSRVDSASLFPSAPCYERSQQSRTLPSLLCQLFKAKRNSDVLFQIRIVFTRCLSLSTPKVKQLMQTLSGQVDGSRMLSMIDPYLKPLHDDDESHIRSFVGLLRGVIRNLGLTPVSVLNEVYCTDSDSEFEEHEAKQIEPTEGAEKQVTSDASISVATSSTTISHNSAASPVLTQQLSYLDVGVGRGHVASAIGQLLDAQISGLDVVQFSRNVIKDRTLIYDGIHIPFSDCSFHIVSTFQVLHHVNNVAALLPEIFRVLKPGGSLLMKEHDVRDDLTFNLVLLEHALHDYRRGGLGLERLIETPVSLKKKKEWDTVLKGVGFTEYRSSEPSWGSTQKETTSSDPTRSFYARWVKPEC